MANEPPFISDHAQSMVGQVVHYTGNRPDRDVRGTITAAEFAGCTVTNERGKWLGVRFRIKPLDGGRAFWTHAMPDEEPRP
jgi:hypothetical protein